MRSFLLHLSENKRLAPLIMNNSVSRRVARRFVAGETLNDAVEAARNVNREMRLASLDLLGENVSDEAGARRAAENYLSIFERIEREKLDANVSLKLTQLGLDLSEALCQELLEKIVAHATTRGNFVRIDMEGSAYTERTVEMTMRVRAKYSGVGTVMQAYLYRAEKDVLDLLAAGCRLRLCKGAYQEPPDVAFPKKADVDANYVKLMKLILPSGIYHGIATHDPAMIDATKAFVRAEKDQPRTIRISDAVRDSHGSTGTTRSRRIPYSNLYSIRHRLVSLLHAPLGRTSCKLNLLLAQPAPQKFTSFVFLIPDRKRTDFTI